MFFLLEKLLGSNLYNDICSVVPKESLTEIRIRKNKPVIVKNLSRYFVIDSTIKPEIAISNIIQTATKHSLYAYEEEIANGYLFYEGGIRIGVAGVGVSEKCFIKTFKEISSINIRIPHEVIGCSSKVFNVIKNISSTLVISLPGAGKTTLIRDMVRVLGKDNDVLLIDERNEISGGGLNSGIFDIGQMTDVISNVKKEYVFEGAIRAMSPKIIVFDEIFPQRDIITISEINRCGIIVLASIHAKDEKTLLRYFPEIERYFNYFIVLESNPKIGSIKSITEVRDGKHDSR